MDRFLVISSDCHAGLPPEQYREYVDPQHRETFDLALPIQKHMMEEASRQFLIADINAEWRKGREELLTGAWDHEQRIKVLDGDGIAAEIIFPDGITEMNAPPFGGGFAMPAEGVVAELPWEGCRAHNRWLAEFVSMAPERRVGCACIPIFWDVEEAVKEIRWARESGLRGLIFPVAWGKQPPYHDTRYDPIWAVCQELELPIHYHSGLAPTEDYFGPLGPHAAGEATNNRPGAVGIYISEVCWYNVRPLTFMLWGGVFERFPKLRYILTESGCAWAPGLMRQMDGIHMGMKMGMMGEVDFANSKTLKEPPSFYAKRNCWYGASFPSPQDLAGRDYVGVDHILWGNDYPHYEGCYPYSRENMRLAFSDIDENEVRMMLGENAAKLYGFDLAALRPRAEELGITPELVRVPLDEIPDSGCPTFQMAKFERQGMPV